MDIVRSLAKILDDVVLLPLGRDPGNYVARAVMPGASAVDAVLLRLGLNPDDHDPDTDPGALTAASRGLDLLDAGSLRTA